MRWAVAVEPVKETNGMSGWPTRASPALGPVPNTMLTTPAGTPAEAETDVYVSIIHFLSLIFNTVNGVEIRVFFNGNTLKRVLTVCI